MSRIFGTALFVIFVALIGRASADQLTFYSDEASWRQAEAGLSIAPYPYGTTVTDVYTTVETNELGYCCNIIGSNSATSTDVPFLNFYFNFSAVGDLYDQECFLGPPGCTVTDITETIINFNTGIQGFASSDALLSSEVGLIVGTINGQLIPFVGGPFFGAVGDISSLDFLSGYVLYDYFHNEIDLNDIVVATTPVSEPSAFACLAVGLLIFMFALARFRGRAFEKISWLAAWYR